MRRHKRYEKYCKFNVDVLKWKRRENDKYVLRFNWNWQYRNLIASRQNNFHCIRYEKKRTRRQGKMMTKVKFNFTFNCSFLYFSLDFNRWNCRYDVVKGKLWYLFLPLCFSSFVHTPHDVVNFDKSIIIIWQQTWQLWNCWLKTCLRHTICSNSSHHVSFLLNV